MATRKRVGDVTDVTDKKDIDDFINKKPLIVPEPPISILRESKYTDRTYRPLKDGEKISLDPDFTTKRVYGLKNKLTRSLEPKPDKIANSTGVLVKKLSEEERSRRKEEKKIREEEARDHIEIINKLQSQKDLQAVMSQIQTEINQNITEKNLRAIISQNCRESTRGEPVEIEGCDFEQQNKIMDIIDDYKVPANTGQAVAMADDECKPGGTSSRCTIMGGKRTPKIKTKKRNRRTKKKTKRRKTNRSTPK